MQDAGEPPAPAEETSPTGEADVASTSSASAEESATGDHSESAPGLPPSTLTLDFEGGSGKLVPSDESTASSPSPDGEVTSPAPDPEPASPPKVAPSPPSDGPRQRKAPTEAAGTGQDMGTMESQVRITRRGIPHCEQGRCVMLQGLGPVHAVAPDGGGAGPWVIGQPVRPDGGG